MVGKKLSLLFKLCDKTYGSKAIHFKSVAENEAGLSIIHPGARQNGEGRGHQSGNAGSQGQHKK